MSLVSDLDAHVASDPSEATDLARIRAFVNSHAWPFDRGILAAHLTASAVVVSADGTGVLLVHHRRLNRWLQPGGHAEAGETQGEDVALREAREETGVSGLAVHPAWPRLLDVDVHRIPARRGVSEHDHLDLRYLVVAPCDAPLRRCDEETRDARWFTWGELGALGLDPAAHRMFEKARAIVDRERDGRLSHRP